MPALSVFPFWKTNPYLNLLFLEPRARGWQVRGGNSVEEFHRDADDLAAGDVFHIQWTRPLSERVTSEAEFRDVVAAFVTKVAQLRERGVRVLWTVHNTIAHDAEYPVVEVELAKQLVRLAERVLVLNSHTPQVTSALYEIPADKVFHLPHPSYLGVYSEDIPQAVARRALGIESQDAIIGFVGAIRPYKGVGDLLAGASIVGNQRSDVSLLLAGSTHDAAWPEIEAHLPLPLPAIRHHEFVPDEDLANWVAACSVMVLPFRQVLNSGSMMLAATYGVPIVLPDLPHLTAEYGDQAWVRFFAADGDAEQRAEAIALAINESLDARPQNSEAAARFARTYTPWNMSTDYANLLENI